MSSRPLVTLTFYGPAQAAAGLRQARLPLPAEATVAGLRRDAAATWPALAPLLPRCAVACNGALVTDETPLSGGAEVDLLPPVSGG